MKHSLLELYMKKFGRLAPDPLCPELRAWNTFKLHDLWVRAVQADPRAPIPYWGIVWPGGRALAKYVLDNRELFRGLRVLDVGTGSGIAAIAAVRAGSIATGIDVDPVSIEMAGKTARINRVSCTFIHADALAMNDDELSAYDIILAGDLFYEAEMAARAESLLRRTARLGLKNIAADVGRTFRPRTGLRVLCSMRVPVYREIEGVESRDTTIISLEA